MCKRTTCSLDNHAPQLHDGGSPPLSMCMHNELPNEAAKIWAAHLPMLCTGNAPPWRPSCLRVLPGGWVSSCGCWGAPVCRLLSAGASNRPQHRQPLIRTPYKRHTSQRVGQQGPNMSYGMYHGTCRRWGAANVGKRCSALEHIAEFLSNVL